MARVYNDRVGATFSGGYTVAVTGVAQMLQGALPEALEKFREGLTKQQAELDKSFASAALFSC